MPGWVSPEMEKIEYIIREGAGQRLTDIEFIENEINLFKRSPARKEMKTGIRYYEGFHDILKKKREVIGEGGARTEVTNLPNNKIKDNQYRKAVTQKKNYLLGQPVVVTSENEQYNVHLKSFFSHKFHRLLKNIGTDSINCAVGWMFINYNEQGELVPQKFNPLGCIPLWRDEAHTMLDAFIRVYKVIDYRGKISQEIEKVELYVPDGIYYFTGENGGLAPANPAYKPYFYIADDSGEPQGYNWSKIPIIPFRCNQEEIPLIRHTKSLQDAINKIISNFVDNMEEDGGNSILIVVNAEDTDLGLFRKNLSTYRTIKVRNTDGDPGGDVKSLQVEVNSTNYQAVLDILKKALIENAMSYDAKDDKIGANANQLNIMSMYNDIDLDANEMETEYQAAFEELIWFFKAYLSHIGAGDFEHEEMKVIFNRDMLMNESEIIETLNGDVTLSMRTKLENHPWVDDVQKELDRRAEEELEQQATIDNYSGGFISAGNIEVTNNGEIE